MGDTTPNQVERPINIRGIDVLSTEKGPLLFYHTNTNRIYATALPGNESWTIAIDITNYTHRALSTAFYIKSVSSSFFNGTGIIAWIDSRFAETDRRWWKPLGGWPWSDQPDWSNNDIALMSIVDIQKSLGTGRSELITQDRLQRITRPMSYADIMRVHASSNPYIVIWTGRSMVGKTKNSFGGNSEVFIVQIP